MVPLIEEWAEKAGHKDSMLLRWSEEDPDQKLECLSKILIHVLALIICAAIYLIS